MRLFFNISIAKRRQTLKEIEQTFRPSWTANRGLEALEAPGPLEEALTGGRKALAGRGGALRGSGGLAGRSSAKVLGLQGLGCRG